VSALWVFDTHIFIETERERWRKLNKDKKRVKIQKQDRLRKVFDFFVMNIFIFSTNKKLYIFLMLSGTIFKCNIKQSLQMLYLNSKNRKTSKNKICLLVHILLKHLWEQMILSYYIQCASLNLRKLLHFAQTYKLAKQFGFNEHAWNQHLFIVIVKNCVVLINRHFVCYNRDRYNLLIIFFTIIEKKMNNQFIYNTFDEFSKLSEEVNGSILKNF